MRASYLRRIERPEDVRAVKDEAKQELEKTEGILSRLLSDYVHGARVAILELQDQSNIQVEGLTQRMGDLLHATDVERSLTDSQFRTLQDLSRTAKNLESVHVLGTRLLQLHESATKVQLQLEDILKEVSEDSTAAGPARVPVARTSTQRAHQLVPAFKHLCALASEARHAAMDIVQLDVLKGDDRAEARARIEAFLDKMVASIQDAWSAFYAALRVFLGKVSGRGSSRTVQLEAPMLVAIGKCAALHERILMHELGLGLESTNDREYSALDDAVLGLTSLALALEDLRPIRQTSAAVTAVPAGNQPEPTGARSAGLQRPSVRISLEMSPSRPVHLGRLFTTSTSYSGSPLADKSDSSPVLYSALLQFDPDYDSTSPRPLEHSWSPSTMASGIAAPAPAGPLPELPALAPGTGTGIGTVIETTTVSGGPLDLSVPDHYAMLEFITHVIVSGFEQRFSAFVLKPAGSSISHDIERFRHLVESIMRTASRVAQCLPPRAQIISQLQDSRSLSASLLYLLEALLDRKSAPTPTSLQPEKLVLLVCWIADFTDIVLRVGPIASDRPTRTVTADAMATRTEGSAAQGPSRVLALRDTLDAACAQFEALHRAQCLRSVASLTNSCLQLDYSGPLVSAFSGQLSLPGGRDLVRYLLESLSVVQDVAAGSGKGSARMQQLVLQLNGTVLADYARQLTYAIETGLRPQDLQRDSLATFDAKDGEQLSSSWRRIFSSSSAAGSRSIRRPWDIFAVPAFEIDEPRSERIDRCCAWMNNAALVLDELQQLLVLARDDPVVGGDAETCDALQTANRAWKRLLAAVQDQLVRLIMNDCGCSLWTEIGGFSYYTYRRGEILACILSTVDDYMQDLARYLVPQLLPSLRRVLAEYILTCYISRIVNPAQLHRVDELVQIVSAEKELLVNRVIRPCLPPASGAAVLDFLNECLALSIAPTPETFTALYTALLQEKPPTSSYFKNMTGFFVNGMLRARSWKRKQLASLLSTLATSAPGPAVDPSVERIVELMLEVTV